MQNNWRNRIQQHETPPPAGAWLNIANELDKEEKNSTEDLTIKILDYESLPPVTALANIFNQLDKEEEEQSASPAFAEKLKEYKQTPPAAAWQNIIGQLDKDENVIQLYPKKRSMKTVYLRIATAAAVIAVVWIAVISNNKTVSVNDTVTIKPIEKEHLLQPTVNAPVDPVILPAAPLQTNLQHKNDVAITPVSKTVRLQSFSTMGNDYIKGNDVKDLAQSPSMHKEKLQDVNGQTPMDIALLNTPNTYISVTGADGQSVKVSSKFSNLIGAFSNNSETKEGIDIIIDESAKWRPIIQAWKNKMTNNAIAPSLSNFMDIIALSEVLEEKK